METVGNPFSTLHKAELPFFPQAFEVLRYDVADIFQGRYPVHV